MKNPFKMALDPVIEKLSFSIFNHLFYEFETIPKPDNYREEPTSAENITIVHAVVCRQEMFGLFNKSEFEKHYQSWRKSEQHFYYYLCKKFSNFTDYLDPNIFDKILIVFAFVVQMGICTYYRTDEIYHTFPIIFAKFFDGYLKEEFLSNGGILALVNYSNKYRAVNVYVFDFLISESVSADQKRFISSLITRIKKDYHFEYLLILLNEHISKYGNDPICRKCKSFKGLTTEQILEFAANDLTFVEIFLQICLKFMNPRELHEFNNTIVNDLQHHHINCKNKVESDDSVKVDFLEPCLKCYIPTITKQDTHSGQTNIHYIYSKPIFLRKAATQEVIKRMLDQKTALQPEVGCNFCAFCSEKLKLQGVEVQLEIAEELASKKQKVAEESDLVKNEGK